MSLQRILLLLVLAVLALVVAAMGPEIQRYLKIRSM
jgi:hypothetical protein